MYVKLYAMVIAFSESNDDRVTKVKYFWPISFMLGYEVQIYCIVEYVVDMYIYTYIYILRCELL